MNINELIKGIIIGVAKIIPGLSGAVLMISFNLYDRAIDAITNFFQNPKKNIIFLLNLGIGIVVGIVLFSRLISFLITKYYLYTTMLFIGLIIGGIPILGTKIQNNFSNYFLIFISFFIMSMLVLSNPSYTYIPQNNFIDILIYFFSGILEALGTVLPGISSTALLMLLGVYQQYLTILGNAFDVTLLKETMSFVFPFSLGLFIGIIVISLLINYLLKKYQEPTFSIILGISASSVFTLLIKLIPYLQSPSLFLISIFLLFIGYQLTNQLS